MAKKMTIEDLAVMVKRGFDETAKKADVETQFDEMGKRLDRIENILIAGHDRRLYNAEDDIRVIKTKVRIP